MTLTSKPLAVVIVVMMFGGIFFASAAGWWKTEASKEAAVYTEGEFAGQANPADIRGSYTLADIEKNFGVPVDVLAQAFGVQSAGAAGFAVKGLEEMVQESPQEIGVASVRLFVAFYQGLPIDLSSDTYVPASAAALLRSRNLSAEQAAYLEAHTVTEPAPAGEAAPSTQPPGATALLPTPETAQEGTPQATAGTVKGKTTFAELQEWGLKAEAIEQVLGTALPDAPGMTVKDFCTQNGLDFETIKAALQAELDKME